MRPSKTKKEAVATAMDTETTSENEVVEAMPRSYAAAVAMPGTTPATEGRLPPGPPPPGSSRSPSPRPGGSGLAPQVSSKKRKREMAKEPVLQESDSDVEQNTDMGRRHRLMLIELANANSRACSLQNSVEEFQQGLAESTSMNEEYVRREEEIRRLHSEELKAQEDRLTRMQELEAERVLAAHRQQFRYAKLRRSKVSYFLEFSAKLSAILILTLIDKMINIRLCRNAATVRPVSALPGVGMGEAATPPGPAPPVEATGSGGPMEPSVTRQQMERFKGLYPCLRKPCPWLGSCRNLHISYGKQK